MAPTIATCVKRSRVVLLGSLALLGSCNGSTGPDLNTLRFGQVGEIRIQLVQPLRMGVGELQQILTWASSGPWQLSERISYRGVLGDEKVRVSDGDPDLLAVAYASIITLLNETAALKLFIEDLDPSLSPPCGLTGTRLILRIRDEGRNDQVTWIRCTAGNLSALNPAGAGPDTQASRVVQAAVLVKEVTLGAGFVPAFDGSVPFATLDRGENSNAPLAGPLSFPDEEGWPEFWARHASPGEPPPPVDFAVDQVIVAAVGLRREAGSTVEVRRILQVGVGSLTDLRERVPGDFCSPAARDQTPFHIVVAPKTPLPMVFAEIRVERVPCG